MTLSLNILKIVEKVWGPKAVGAQRKVDYGDDCSQTTSSWMYKLCL